MANKADRFYFENFISAIDDTCKAADYLVECLTNYDPANMTDMLEHMHTFEHAGDQKKHDMHTALAKAFVTPIDREDLAEVSQNIDDVTDKIEEILQRFYVDQICKVTPEAITFAQKIAECCALTKQVLSEFENFKKPARLSELIIEVNNAEEECDRFYLDATIKLRKQCSDVLEIISWREIYDYMEDCIDACEHVADSVGTVVMKNS
ncbi:MAG: DUF47 family protein [Clostridia bacterium]|nr:DUF47 family protein [Clostridia bacterium]